MNEESISDPYAVLALAVVFKAALDLKSKNPTCALEARTWLQFVGLSWCQMLGISEKEISKWIASNFSLPSNTHRNWRY
jgi:hypothetical protein